MTGLGYFRKIRTARVAQRRLYERMSGRDHRRVSSFQYRVWLKTHPNWRELES